jgi:hypothetical protein
LVVFSNALEACDQELTLLLHVTELIASITASLDLPWTIRGDMPCAPTPKTILPAHRTIMLPKAIPTLVLGLIEAIPRNMPELLAVPALDQVLIFLKIP